VHSRRRWGEERSMSQVRYEDAMKIIRVYDLELDREWFRQPRVYYVYRGPAEASELYVLKSVLGDELPARIRLRLGSKLTGGRLSYELELDREMLQKVASKYLYRSREMVGSYHSVGGIYVLRSELGERPPDTLCCSLEW
jgi:hypothetical protein